MLDHLTDKQKKLFFIGGAVVLIIISFAVMLLGFQLGQLTANLF